MKYFLYFCIKELRKLCGFFSVSDLNMLVNELVRFVRVYLIFWEEKSVVFKKLYEDYENK